MSFGGVYATRRRRLETGLHNERGRRKPRTKLARLNHAPLEALHIQRERSKRGEEDDRLQAVLLALIVLGLRCPVEEGDNILRHLGGGGGCA